MRAAVLHNRLRRARGKCGGEQDRATPDDRLRGAPEDWVTERTEKAHDRLSKSDAGKLLLRSLNTHGGLQRWFANGPVHFRFNYRPLEEGAVRDTFQTIDTWRSRARHQLASDRASEFGWDGEHAWVSPPDAETLKSPRFWALTPYYFIGMPFVLADPGVHLKKTGSAELNGRPHDIITATFGEAVGDSPDDYYIIYLDAETGRFGGLRYIVSYPGFYPDGGHSPEKLMVYEGAQTVDDITFAEHFPTYKWDPDAEARGPKVTDVAMSDVEFRPKTEDAFFDAPEGAKMLEGY